MTRRRYVTLAEAADYLGISPDALRMKVTRGQVPHIKIDRRLRFDLMDLDLLMRRHRIEADAS